MQTQTHAGDHKNTSSTRVLRRQRNGGSRLFRYLGRPIIVDRSYRLVVTYNLKKARGRWAQVLRVLTKQHINLKWLVVSTKPWCKQCYYMDVKLGPYHINRSVPWKYPNSLNKLFISICDWNMDIPTYRHSTIYCRTLHNTKLHQQTTMIYF
jgi:hypothetical protein